MKKKVNGPNLKNYSMLAFQSFSKIKIGIKKHFFLNLVWAIIYLRLLV